MTSFVGQRCVVCGRHVEELQVKTSCMRVLHVEELRVKGPRAAFDRVVCDKSFAWKGFGCERVALPAPWDLVTGQHRFWHHEQCRRTDCADHHGNGRLLEVPGGCKRLLLRTLHQNNRLRPGDRNMRRMKSERYPAATQRRELGLQGMQCDTMTSNGRTVC